ncbi:hypothetical protein LMXM_04_0390 [Leishmania mexicana MHOM/GT/2001/U1103]|uniref:C-type lectin domain-containing protein n=1 Tax=Leishmania mexicana (strain MHOM/GT/2001/U1103) TaxID=929439 RepID=E9AK20_LEIMU|nr:hypothetical protein LMXM_04_0390 [Leishmania mexicana MHOM/GT/2001/U1103]CBZ23270.1 hypothetical protein LMXM_04_0390 [Leishmania mexicana MHOM/GT/2001/U1103]
MCLAAGIVSAGMLLAPSDSKIPFTTIGQLQQVCAATQAGSTPVAMYTAAMTALVVNLMNEQKVTQAYVSAYLNADRRWTWSVYEGGDVIETLMNSNQWASGNPTGAHTTYRHAAYSTTDKGLISVTGYDNYPVICNYENRTDYSPPGKRFPWWGTLILVAAVVVVAVAVAVCCLCCKRKQFDDAGDEDSELTTHNASFGSCGTSHTDSDKSDGSSVFTSRRSSFSGSENPSAGSSSS